MWVGTPERTTREFLHTILVTTPLQREGQPLAFLLRPYLLYQLLCLFPELVVIFILCREC